jgi:hypothetical protein
MNQTTNTVYNKSIQTSIQTTSTIVRDYHYVVLGVIGIVIGGLTRKGKIQHSNEKVNTSFVHSLEVNSSLFSVVRNSILGITVGGLMFYPETYVPLVVDPIHSFTKFNEK